MDVIATLQKIMEHNTDFFQTDFQYDVEKLREAAEDRGGYRGFFWLTRKGGTWCFPERDVYIRNTSTANTWMFYGGCGSENVKAYWIGLKRVEGDDRKIIGDIVEMDYQKHLDYLCTHSLDPAYVEVVFKSPNDVRTFSYQEYQKNWPSISQRYGVGVSIFTSSADLGHFDAPCSSLLYSRMNPSRAQYSPFSRSRFRPQNRNSVLVNGSSSNCCCTIVAKPSIPLRRSVYPQAM